MVAWLKFPAPGLHQESLAEAWMIWQRALAYPVSQICGQRASAQLQCDVWTQRDSKRTLPAMNSLVDEDTKLDEHSVTGENWPRAQPRPSTSSFDS